MSAKLKLYIKRGSMSPCIVNNRIPHKPHEKRKPKPTPNESFVYFLIILKMRSYEPKQKPAAKLPKIILITFMLKS